MCDFNTLKFIETCFMAQIIVNLGKIYHVLKKNVYSADVEWSVL